LQNRDQSEHETARQKSDFSGRLVTLGDNEVSLHPNLECRQNSKALDVISRDLRSFNPITTNRRGGHPVLRSPEQLRLHRALDEFGWTGGMEELNHAARLKDRSAPEPVLITTNGTRIFDAVDFACTLEHR
jgi:hypothetical protein